jgi:hypothetical protein
VTRITLVGAVLQPFSFLADTGNAPHNQVADVSRDDRRKGCEGLCGITDKRDGAVGTDRKYAEAVNVLDIEVSNFIR